MFSFNTSFKAHWHATYRSYLDTSSVGMATSLLIAVKSLRSKSGMVLSPWSSTKVCKFTRFINFKFSSQILQFLKVHYLCEELYWVVIIQMLETKVKQIFKVWRLRSAESKCHIPIQIIYAVSGICRFKSHGVRLLISPACCANPGSSHRTWRNLCYKSILVLFN